LAKVFLTQLAIKPLLKFPPQRTSASALRAVGKPDQA